MSQLAADGELKEITDAVSPCLEMTEISRRVLERQGDVILYRVRANGFLYHMVRILAGTLLAVAEGRLEPDDIPAVTASRDRSRAGITMPAEGLYLNRVVYPGHLFRTGKENR